jgi:AcrR family transcriptional regulator
MPVDDARSGKGLSPAGPRRRGRRRRYTEKDVIEAAVAIADSEGMDAVTIRAVAARLEAAAMSLYSYVDDKQALVYRMVEHVSALHPLPSSPSGDWRADLHRLADRQRDILYRHPWMIEAISQRQPLGPATLDYLEFVLAALEPLGEDPSTRMETAALLVGVVVNLVRAELAEQDAARPGAAQMAAEAERLQGLLATGRYPRFAAAVALAGARGAGVHATGREAAERAAAAEGVPGENSAGMGTAAEPAAEFRLADHFDRLIDRMLDGLVKPGV